VIVRIVSDEWYPVFWVGDEQTTCNFVIDADDEQVARWLAARKAFDESQDEILALVKEKYPHGW
jgi:hypothetical protein